MLQGSRILLVDDHNVVRSSIGLMITTHGAEIVGEAETGQAAVAQALALRPDVIVMDITLPDMDGIEATSLICAAWPEARILALTMHSEEMYLIPFLKAGGMGYVRKAAADREVIQAIATLLRGERFIGAEGINSLIQQNVPAQTNQQPGPEVLSERERSVLELTARGFTSREIGDQLSLSPHTIDTYRARIMEKLGLQTRHELVDFAIRYRILGQHRL